MFLVGSLSVQTVDHLPPHYHLKRERKGLCELPSPFNNFFLSGDSSTMKERLGRGLTKAAQALPKLPRDSGAGLPPAGHSW